MMFGECIYVPYALTFAFGGMLKIIMHFVYVYGISYYVEVYIANKCISNKLTVLSTDN